MIRNISPNQQSPCFTAKYSTKLTYRLQEQYGNSPEKMRELQVFEEKLGRYAPSDSRLGIIILNKNNTPERLVISLYKEISSRVKSTISLSGIEMDECMDFDTGKIDYLTLFRKHLTFLNLRKLERGLAKRGL